MQSRVNICRTTPEVLIDRFSDWMLCTVIIYVSMVSCFVLGWGFGFLIKKLGGLT